MASDEDYAAFLDKANQDPNEGVRKSQSSGKIQLKAVDEGVQIPAALKKAVGDAFYVSDADEPFEVVGLKAEGGLPDEGMFAHFFYSLCTYWDFLRMGLFYTLGLFLRIG